MRADLISRIVGLIGFAVGGFYLEERAIKWERAWEIFSQLALNEKQWHEAIRYARIKKLLIIADVYGRKSLMLAKKLGVDGF